MFGRPSLTASGLKGTASCEDMSGGGGGKASGYLIAHAESNYSTLMVNSMSGLTAAFDADPSGTAIGRGSVLGGMDHLVAAMVMEAAGQEALSVTYVPNDEGGKAMAALLSGEIAARRQAFLKRLIWRRLARAKLSA